MSNETSGWQSCLWSVMSPSPSAPPNSVVDETPVRQSSTSPSNTSVDTDVRRMEEFSTFRSLLEAVEKHELSTNSTYTIINEKHGFEVDTCAFHTHIKDERDVKLYWNKHKPGEATPIKFTGVPFIILNRRIYPCHQGKDMQAKKKARGKMLRKERAAKDMCSTFKPRNITKPSKKLGCEARFVVKKLLFFPEYRISHEATSWKRQQKAKELKNHLVSILQQTKNNTRVDNYYHDDEKNVTVPSGKLEVKVVLKYLTIFPDVSDHHEHCSTNGYIEPIINDMAPDPDDWTSLSESSPPNDSTLNKNVLPCTD